MKTTLELPDRLMRQVKIRAARTDRTMKEVMTELITRGLSATPAAAPPERLDLSQYIGKWPRYRSVDDLNAHMDELRQDRDVAD